MDSTFYVTGGTLRADSPSYVERQADKDLYDGLLKGEFCYVLTSRQMGKSSLMVRTANKLRQQGTNVIALDLTAIGQNLTPEQWYDGLIVRMGRQLRLEDELEDFWLHHERLSPVQRLFAAIRDVAMVKRPGKLVVFVDELDVVRSLPFSTDEFFAAIRECYTRRTEDDEFNRLTFCLLGVATPSDLIRDTRITPFNIGRRIELNDFTPAEVAPLAAGFAVSSEFGVSSFRFAEAASVPENLKRETSNSELLLDRILYWTNGHPYLTQRLCRAVSEAITNSQFSIFNSQSIDSLCEELFLSPRAREKDDNLLFVRERLLRSDANLASLLDLYLKVRRVERVIDDENNPLVSVLRLAGIVRLERGNLVLRNRIYARVFDGGWVRANMPDAELRRQRAAFRRGLVRPACIAAVIVTLMLVLASITVRQAYRAYETARSLRRNLYVADMKVAQLAVEENNLGRATQLLEKYFPGPGDEDLRGFEWRYLWSSSRGDEIFTFRGHNQILTAALFSPDGKILLTASRDGRVMIWDASAKKVIHTLTCEPENINQARLAFSPDGKTLAYAAAEQGELFETDRWQKFKELQGSASGLSFSSDGKTLLARIGPNGATSWNTATWHTTLITIEDLKDRNLTFFPDGTVLAGHFFGMLDRWDLPSERKIGEFKGLKGPLASQAVSPNGKFVAGSSFDGGVTVWDAETQQLLWTTAAHDQFCFGLAFSPDSKTLASSGEDHLIRLWDVAGGRSLSTLQGHSSAVGKVMFSPDGRTLASASKDGTAKLWSAVPKPQDPGLTNAIFTGGEIMPVWLSANGRTLGVALQTSPFNRDQRLGFYDVITRQITNGIVPLENYQDSKIFVPGIGTSEQPGTISSDGQGFAVGKPDGDVQLWNLLTGKPMATLQGFTNQIEWVEFSPSKTKLAASSRDHVTRVWNLATGNVEHVFTNSFRPIAFSPDETILAAVGDHDTVTLWNLTTNQKGKTLRGHRWTIVSVAFSPQGKLVATASLDNTARLWETASGHEIASLEGHKVGVTSVAFSPDGKTLASSSDDKTIKLWKVETGQELLTLKGLEVRVVRVLFSPDGETLVAGFAGRKALQLWRVPSFAEIESERTRGLPKE